MKGWVKGIIAGVVIALIGVCVLVLGLYLNGWKFTVPVNGKDFEMRTFTAENENTNLVLSIDAGSVSTEYIDGDKIIIEYPYSENYQTQVTEENGTVTLSHPEHHFKISFANCNVSIPHTTVKLPRGKVFNLEVDMNAGTFSLADGEFGTVNIKINAGTLRCETINCRTFSCNMNAGTLSFDKLTCTDFTYKINAGTVKVDSLTAENTRVKMNAGTVKLGFTSALAEYTIRADVDAGSCKVDGNRAENQSGTTDKIIDVEVNAGTVKLTFLQAD